MKILCLYIGAILKQILFCIDGVINFARDFLMLRVEGESLIKIMNAVKCQQISSNCINWATI